MQPIPSNPNQPRYTKINFPHYRHVPGVTPHPISNPQGHSYGKEINDKTKLTDQNWKTNETYLFAIDLFNYSFWWECHEYLEALWNNIDVKTAVEKLMLQGIIQLAAGLIKWHQKNHNGMKKLFKKSKEKFEYILEKTQYNYLFGINLLYVIEITNAANLSSQTNLNVILDLNFKK